MEVDRIKEIIEKLPTQSRIVEIHYRDENIGDDVVRPGYLIGIKDTKLEDIPEMWRKYYGKGKEHPELRL